jgi:hypothetical protein
VERADRLRDASLATRQAEGSTVEEERPNEHLRKGGSDLGDSESHRVAHE